MSLAQNGKALDFETTKYYHNLDDVLTPLEVSAIKKRGFIKRGKTVIYGELLTGLITTIDKLLKRNNIDPVRHLRHNGVKRRRKAVSNGVDAITLNSFKI